MMSAIADLVACSSSENGFLEEVKDGMETFAE